MGLKIKNFFVLVCVFLYTLLFAESYELGHGYKIDDALNLGAYFSLDYSKGKNIDKAQLSDVAVLAYGTLPANFSYLVELEAAPFYVKDFQNDTSQTNSTPHRERMYLDYATSDMFNFRVGKLITPIGYWNLEPINVLRDTTSNPLYSYRMFPKFVTGLDTYGYADEDTRVQYHLFLQATEDIDKDYINIRNDFFVGGSLGYEVTDELDVGASLGYYETYEKKEVSLVEGNAKYESYPFEVQTEWAYTAIHNNVLNANAFQIGGYLQGMYSFNPQNALVSRYEYFQDTQVATKSKNHIGIIGYSYRPVYAVSIKGEYQFNSDSSLNKAIISLSVLF